MQTIKINYVVRSVSDHGETLVVRVLNGCKALVDPCDKATAVVVPSGRRARLVRFNFSGLYRPNGRDTLTEVLQCEAGLGFSAVGFSSLNVLLRDLSEGQVVDVLPAGDSAAAYAVVLRPLPVFYGAATAEPVYAAVAA